MEISTSCHTIYKDCTWRLPASALFRRGFKPVQDDTILMHGRLELLASCGSTQNTTTGRYGSGVNPFILIGDIPAVISAIAQG